MRRNDIIITITTLLSFCLSFYFYPQLPDKMVFGWYIDGVARSSLSKELGMSIQPIIAVFILIGFVLNKSHRREKTIVDTYTEHFIVIISLFFLYFQTLVIAWNLKPNFNFVQLLQPALGFVIFYVGVVLPHLKRNKWMGIRTPWTFSSDEVWDKTHLLGTKLYRITGVITVLTAVLPYYGFFIAVSTILLTTFTLIIYSYVLYTGEDKK